MEEYYRDDPPVPVEQLAGVEAPYDLCIESLFYYNVHVKQSKWSKHQIALKNWFLLVQLLRKQGLSHRGYDYPDWRRYSLISLDGPVIRNLVTDLKWYAGADWIQVATLVEENSILLDGEDVITNMAYIRTALESGKNVDENLPVYMISLLHTKYRLINSSPSFHDSLLPVYNNLYSLLLNVFKLHDKIFRSNSFWCLHSTLFLFPHEIGKLDVKTFKDRTSWLINGMVILGFVK